MEAQNVGEDFIELKPLDSASNVEEDIIPESTFSYRHPTEARLFDRFDSDAGLTPMHYEYEDVNLVTISISNLGDHPIKLDDFIRLPSPIKVPPYSCMEAQSEEQKEKATMPNHVPVIATADSPRLRKKYKLPYGWVKLAAQRSTGATEGKWDIYLISPKGKKLRSGVELKRYLKCNPGLKYDPNATTFKRPEERLLNS